MREAVLPTDVAGTQDRWKARVIFALELVAVPGRVVTGVSGVNEVNIHTMWIYGVIGTSTF
jgi:hypothetical protein